MVIMVLLLSSLFLLLVVVWNCRCRRGLGGDAAVKRQLPDVPRGARRSIHINLLLSVLLLLVVVVVVVVVVVYDMFIRM